MKYLCLIILLLVGLATAQPLKTNTDFPRDQKSTPVSILYAWDGTQYRPLSQSGTVFDSLHVYLPGALPVNWTSQIIEAGRAGFVYDNYATSTAQCSTTTMTRAISIPAGASKWIPVVATVVWFRKHPGTASEVQIQSGEVTQ